MERINHHHLYIYWVLARAGTFTKAAAELGIAQSAVTAQVKQLEETLNLVLVDRTNKRKPNITSEGRKVLEYADSIFEASSELYKWARHGEGAKSQVLRIGALSGLSRNLQYEFLKPVIGDESVKIEITTGDQEKLVRLLKEHSLDIILSSHNVKIEGKTTYYSHVLTTSPILFVVKARAAKRARTLEENLEERPLYIPGKSFEARPELEAYLDRLNSSVRIAGEIDDIALLRILALRSGAIVALPEMGVLNDIESRDIAVLARLTKIEQRFYAVTRQRKFPNAVVEKLIASIRS